MNRSIRSVFSVYRERVRRWPFGALLLGLVFQVAAWILVIPPYSTYDEFDHVYRASSVWHGQLTGLPDPPAGYPGAVIADRDLVRGGVLECMGLPYTSTTRCNVGPPGPDGTVIVTSGAALYNPLYYVLVSPATAVGHGADTVLWLRVWSGLITFAVVGWALFLASTWSRPDTAVRGVILAASPMLTISMAVVAPNGLEMASGLLWWVGLVSLSRHERPGARVWIPLVVAGCLLALLRSLGPLFLVVSVVIMLVWRGPHLRRLWSTSRRELATALTFVGLSLAISAGWVLTQHFDAFETRPLFPDADLLTGFWVSVQQSPTVVALFVAAIPARNLAPPLIVVAAWLIPFVLLLLNVDRRRRRPMIAMVVLAGFVVTFPLLFGALTFRNFGFAWQSRYILPLAIGIPLLAAVNGLRIPARVRVNDAVAIACVLIAQLATIRFGQQWYDDHSPLIRVLHQFPLVDRWVPTLTVVLGVGLTGVALFAARTGDECGPETLKVNSGSTSEQVDPGPVSVRRATDSTTVP